jgi:16S rRNA (cytidine1402-2'-O)-methyltransferase
MEPLETTNAPEQPEITSADHAPLAPGLYLVATPIGNLEDMTLRALRILRSADRIACEDTRQTRKLLNHFAISTPTISCHEHNERERATELLAAIQRGERVALVSDAGMPGISDPGSWLVKAALEAAIPVIPIPGANAAVTALVASGLPTERFRFYGFLPEKSGARRTALESIAAALRAQPELDSATTLIFYEAPHRILDTLADLRSVWGDALPIVVARELTKLHEEFLRGPVATVQLQMAAQERVRGEITLLMTPPPQIATDVGEDLLTSLTRLQEAEKLSEKDALKQLARLRGQSKSEVYRELQRLRATPPRRP